MHKSAENVCFSLQIYLAGPGKAKSSFAKIILTTNLKTKMADY